MCKKTFIFFLLVSSLVFAASVTDYLGETYVKVIKGYGFPNSIFPVRQSTATQDDVVFMYDFSYFYFYNNHFYRVYYSSEYKNEIYKGIKIGAKKSALTNVFGDKYSLEKDGLIWNMKNYLVLAKMDESNRLKGLWFIKEVQKQ